MGQTYRHLDTAALHAGEPKPRVDGAVVMPIFQSATYEYRGETTYADNRYIRLNNTPNHLVLHDKLAALEQAEAAMVTASGMAAISATLLTVLSAGDHLLTAGTLYGGTHGFLTHDFASLGLTYDAVDALDPDSWPAAVKPTTKAIYVESISNPLVEVSELEAVVEFARAHGLTSIIDNTFASPVNFRPAPFGFDIVVHSGTKYLNGHTDMVAGVVAGSRAWIERINAKMLHLGGSLDPHACFLLHRGLKTLGLRVRQQNSNALAIAQFLETHPAVARVNYPGLESSPSHGRATKWFDGYGGMVSFELDGDAESARRAVARLQLPVDAPSLGGVESLVTRPVTTSHSGVPPAEREKLGIRDGLIRYSVGIEAVEDLIDDLRQALE
jgi:cystathionine beta-lyase/cystathionine gamma-synthase